MFGWMKQSWLALKFWMAGVDLHANIETIRNTTAEICGFLPTVQTVVNILSLGNPALSAVGAVATAICKALTQAKAAQGITGGDKPVPEVEGVVIEGEWL
jgi:hypothetical protein